MWTARYGCMLVACVYILWGAGSVPRGFAAEELFSDRLLVDAVHQEMALVAKPLAHFLPGGAVLAGSFVGFDTDVGRSIQSRAVRDASKMTSAACRVGTPGCPGVPLTRSVRGQFDHTAPPLPWLKECSTGLRRPSAWGAESPLKGSGTAPKSSSTVGSGG